MKEKKFSDESPELGSQASGKVTREQKEIGELLSNWIPYLSEGFCKRCSQLLQFRVENLAAGKVDKIYEPNGNVDCSVDYCSAQCLSLASQENSSSASANDHHKKSNGSSNQAPGSDSIRQGQLCTPDSSRRLSIEHSGSSSNGKSRGSSNGGSKSEFSIRRSQFHTPWTNRQVWRENSGSSANGYDYSYHGNSKGDLNAEFSTRWGHNQNLSPATNSKVPLEHLALELSLDDELSGVTLPAVDVRAANDSEVQRVSGLRREDREQIRFSQVGRKRDFVHIERINGRPVNVLKGLELHTHVFSAAEQKKIVNYIYSLQEMGRKGQLRERTYSEPRKWMRGKGRITIQFGCCYNYAVDKNGNPPGIIQDEEVDPIPPMFKTIIKRLIKWHVLPPMCVPNSCIVNIYDEGDCIPPHIDHHDFVRPFCTVSFLTECNILFGSNLKIIGPGEFDGPVAIRLPVGSVLILNGNGADVAKHCVPAVPAKRISITFRKMDDNKIPYNFSPDPDLEDVEPLAYTPNKLIGQQTRNMPVRQNIQHGRSDVVDVQERSASSLQLGQDEFPPLDSSSSAKSWRAKQNQFKE